MQVFLLSAFLQVTVRAPQASGVLVVSDLLSSLSSGYVSGVLPAPVTTESDFYQIWQKHRNSNDAVFLQVLCKWMI